MDESDNPSLLAEFLERIRNSPAQNLIDRVEELRIRIVRAVVIVTVFFIACFSGAKPILELLAAPLIAALPEGSKNLNFTGPLDVMMCYMRVSFLLAIILAAPLIFWQIWRYLGPALPPEQRGFVKPFFVASILLFLSGIAFCHYVMMPTTFTYLIGQAKDLATPTIMITDFVSLAVVMLLGFGAVFQLPLILVIAETLGVLELEHLTKHRSFVVVGVLIVAALVVPSPDPFSQLSMAIPMYVMFEAAIIFIRIKRKRYPKPVAPPASPV
jgi:sec-independent protein translocase protein TatC